MSKSLRYWAIKYAGAGYPVFPLEPGDKGPLGAAKDSPFHQDLRRPLRGFKDATTDVKHIGACWKIWPNANIGICPRPGEAIIDVDPRNGGKRMPIMVGTLESISGRGDGGGHLFYSGPPANLPDITGIDIITTGGYVVAPPSIHPDTGLPYEWVDGFDPTRIVPWPKGLVSTTDKPAAPRLNGAHQPLSPSQVRWCLERISPDGYDDWIKVGQALQADYPDEGFDWWVAWSETTKRVFKREPLFEKKWATFDTNGLTTTRTLKHEAEETSGEIMPGSEPAEDFGNDALEADNEDLFDETPKSRNPFLNGRQLLVQKPNRWMIKHVLPETGTALIYGASRSGKTFLTLDFISAILGKKDWRGHKVKKTGKVFYIAAEGGGGFRNRVQALVRSEGIGDREIDNLYTLKLSLQISEKKAVSQLIEWIRELVTVEDGVATIVFDTLSQVMAGIDENQSMMSIALKAADRLSKEFKCLVIFLGHSGKDPTKGLRGWSGFIGAVDTAIEVTRNDEIRTALIYKQRDGEDGAEYSFMLKPVTIGTDEDNDPITTCVLEYCATPITKAKENSLKPKGPNQQIAYKVIREMVVADGTADLEEALSKIAPLMPKTQGRNRQRDIAKQAVDGLKKRNLIRVDGDSITLGEMP